MYQSFHRNIKYRVDVDIGLLKIPLFKSNNIEEELLSYTRPGQKQTV